MSDADVGISNNSPNIEEKQVLGEEEISRSLTRIAFEIVEKNRGIEEVVLLGIRTRGVHLAARLRERLSTEGEAQVPLGTLDITLYRDDLARQPFRTPGATVMPPEGIDGKTVVLIDDVLYSGRTVRAALDAINDIGRPRAVQLAVLVDRGHRELPIRADYVGKNLPTSSGEKVFVFLKEEDEKDAVVIRRGE
ncbi:MAG: bifunctional pyr operon transcriptional regulator/uracil phosphoribosyltransferase PyrR [Actinomycetaceae bacterium]|nr:bifunctional pyr operon transcriptional regulator/uracil phosphoribosyltransferase PyrR [Actinomycetaceae bacterium]